MKKRTLAEIGAELSRSLALLEKTIATGKRRVQPGVMQEIERVLERASQKNPAKRAGKPETRSRKYHAPSG